MRVETTQAEFLSFTELRAVAVVPEPVGAALVALLSVPVLLCRRRNTAVLRTSR